MNHEVGNEAPYLHVLAQTLFRRRPVRPPTIQKSLHAATAIGQKTSYKHSGEAAQLGLRLQRISSY